MLVDDLRAAVLRAGAHVPVPASALRRAVRIATVPVAVAPAATARSRLCQDGSAAELAFSTFDADVRYTVEVAAPAEPPIARLNHAAALARRLGADDGLEEAVAELRRVQAGGNGLRWGAWLGVRHRVDGDRVKLYAEVPSSSSSAPELRDTLPAQGAPGRDVRVVAIGRVVGEGRLERYCEIDGQGMDPAVLRRLMAPVGLGWGAERLFDATRELRQVLLGDPTLPSVDWAFSVSAPRDGSVPVFSLFTLAGDLLGGDGLVRATLMRMALRHGWDLSAYADVTSSLARQALVCRHHNVVGLVLAYDGSLGLHVALSPPPAGEARDAV